VVMIVKIGAVALETDNPVYNRIWADRIKWVGHIYDFVSNIPVKDLPSPKLVVPLKIRLPRS